MTASLLACIFSLAMKKQPENLRTGITVLSGKKLEPFISLWIQKQGNVHNLYKAMDRVDGGRALQGHQLKKIAYEGLSQVVSDYVKYALVVALREVHPLITWDDISEDFEK